MQKTEQNCNTQESQEKLEVSYGANTIQESWIKLFNLLVYNRRINPEEGKKVAIGYIAKLGYKKKTSFSCIFCISPDLLKREIEKATSGCQFGVYVYSQGSLSNPLAKYSDGVLKIY